MMDNIREYLGDTSSEAEFSGVDVQSDYNVSDVSCYSDLDVGGGAMRGAVDSTRPARYGFDSDGNLERHDCCG